MNFAEYVKCIKPYAINCKISDEAFVNALLEPYVLAGKIKNKFKEEYWLNKSRVSRLLSGQDDVPKQLREKLGMVGIYEKTRDNFKNFTKDYLDEDRIEELISDLKRFVVRAGDISLISNADKPTTNLNEFLAAILIETIRLPNGEVGGDSEIIRNGAYSVRIISGDIFSRAFGKKRKNKSIIVIPVDTMFHTFVTRNHEKELYPEVSPTTIHGQWLIRMEQSGEDIPTLRKRIFEYLRNFYREKDDGKTFPFGTIAVIENKCSIFYLLALSEFDKNNNAHAKKEDILCALDSLMKFYDKHGDGNDIYIPLLGTGKSRAGMSLQESCDSIVNYFRNHISYIQGNVFIVVYKKLENHVKRGE